MSPNQISIERYRRCAAGYDASAEFTMPLRLRTIALLDLQPGDVVLDVGAGTGLSLGPLLAAVGPGGRVLAFEQSPEMFEQAPRACGSRGLGRSGLVAVLRGRDRAAGASGRWPCCSTTCTTSPARGRRSTNLMGQLKPGARVAMAGMKFFPWWTGPLNLLAWLKNRPYNALPADLWSPWEPRATLVRWFRALEHAMGHGLHRAWTAA